MVVCCVRPARHVATCVTKRRYGSYQCASEAGTASAWTFDTVLHMQDKARACSCRLAARIRHETVPAIMQTFNARSSTLFWESTHDRPNSCRMLLPHFAFSNNYQLCLPSNKQRGEDHKWALFSHLPTLHLHLGQAHACSPPFTKRHNNIAVSEGLLVNMCRKSTQVCCQFSVSSRVWIHQNTFTWRYIKQHDTYSNIVLQSTSQRNTKPTYGTAPQREHCSLHVFPCRRYSMYSSEHIWPGSVHVRACVCIHVCVYSEDMRPYKLVWQPKFQERHNDKHQSGIVREVSDIC